MDVQIVQHQMPLRGLGIAGHQALDMRKRILFCARRSPGWFDDLSSHNIKIDEPGQRPMPYVLELAPQHVALLHGQVGMLAREGLHPGQLIHANAAFALLGPLWCLSIHFTSLHNLFVALRIGHFGQPIAEVVRLETPFLSSRAACRGEICETMPRAFTSSAISRPVHWLIGRPDLAGASHAKAAI